MYNRWRPGSQTEILVNLAIFFAFLRILGWRIWNRWQGTARMNLRVGRTLWGYCVVVYNYHSRGFQTNFRGLA